MRTSVAARTAAGRHDPPHLVAAHRRHPGADPGRPADRAGPHRPDAGSGAPTVATPFSRMAKHHSHPRVASFNVLGANHTDGPKANKQSFASSTVRTPATVKILDNNGVDIVGFQELNRVQHDQFMGLTKGAWDIYPGDELSNYATHNSIAWRTAKWELVEANTIPITYFDGVRVPMPYLLMRHKASGRLLWVANFHNPASTRHRAPQLKWRTMAKNDEIALANRIHETGVPLIITGDMNEKETYHCAMTSRAPMKAANGGSFGTTKCVAPRDTRIDWIFGSSYLSCPTTSRSAPRWSSGPPTTR